MVHACGFLKDAMTASASLLTPRGRGAVATVAVCGNAAILEPLFQAANGKLLRQQPLGRAVFGRWSGGDGPAAAGEELVLCRTADDCVEIHCHGGEAAAGRILKQLAEVGATLRPWAEFLEQTQGAFAADVATALAAASTARTAAIIAQQAGGPLADALARLAALDPHRQRDAALELLDELLRWEIFARHLTRPWRVVLYGRPNAGKSSLVNALLGYERAIVYDQPGTTRDVLTAETAFDGWPVQLSDTAGLRSDAEALEAAGIARARTSLAAADVRVLVLDRSRPAEPEGDRLPDCPAEVRVLNKCDLPDLRGDPQGALPVSARSGAGLPELMAAIAAALVSVLPPEQAPLPVSERQIAVLSAARQALRHNDVPLFERQIRRLGQPGPNWLSSPESAAVTESAS